ncbi:MAG: SIMPL domain-containing protein, partial [Candidatus Pacebacteria bacterium]|nr:SIMPL domain-containing protein [Candidatus Paceibacterota bacterium]
METTTEQKTGEGRGTCCQTSVLHSNRIHSSLALVLVLLAAFLFAQTINALKEYRYIGGGIAPSNAISVSGTGEIFAVPDTAEFTFSVLEEGATAGAVQQAAATKANELIGALKEKGIDEKDVKTVVYDLQPKYEWQPLACPGYYPCERKQVQKGFILNQSVQVKVRALDKAGDLLTLVADKGATNVSNLSFTIADEGKVKTEARKLAIDEAKAKADKLASDLGVTLVRIVGFNEDIGGYPMPMQVNASREMKSLDAVE